MAQLSELQRLVNVWLEKNKGNSLVWAEETVEDLFKYLGLITVGSSFSPQTGNGYYLCAIYSRVNKQLDQAEAYFELGANLDHELCLLNLSTIHRQKGNYDLAICYGQRSIDLGYTSCFVSMALCYQNHFKDYRKMKEYYRQAIGMNDIRPYRNLGVYYRDIRKNPDKHIRYFQLAYEHGDKDPLVFSNILWHHRKNITTEGFFFVFKHAHMEEVRELGLLMEYQLKASPNRAVIHYLLRVKNDQLIPSYLLLKSFYLENLELRLYQVPTYFQRLPKDVFLHVLTPYLNN